MTRKKNILSEKAPLLRTWGLRATPPFRKTPSENIEELMQVFVNRDEEIRRAIFTLDDGENILVRGMTGIGKTAFIMATLYQVEQDSTSLGIPVLPIHIRQFAGGTRDEFYRVVLYSLAKRLAPYYKRARDIVYALTGEEIIQGRSRGFSAGVEVQVPQLLQVKGEGEISGEQSRRITISYPAHFVDELLDTAVKKKKYRRVIIAVDDIERCPNQGNVKTMLESSLDLIRDNRCAFILTGRALTIIEDIYASGLGIFSETIPLKPLSVDQLRLITVRTLNLVRYQPNDTSTYPFSDKVIETMASKSFGIPRQFILLCRKMLQLAIENNVSELTPTTFDELFEKYQQELADSDVPPDIRRILYLGLQQGGFSVSKDADLDQVFSILGITTFRQFVDFADNLVQQDLLQRFTDDRGEVLYRLAPGIEKLALTGKEIL